MGLELDHQLTIDNIQHVFSQKVTSNKLRRLLRYLSGELFSLDLISRCWHRVDIAVGSPKPRPRMFHEISTGKDCLYVFGGLIVPEEPGDATLVPCNDLWKFDLQTKSWILLHDGKGWENDGSIPSPRFLHKLTIVKSLVYTQRKDHSGLIIAGGRDAKSESLYSNYTFDLVDKNYVGAGAPLVFSTLPNSHKPQRQNSSKAASYFKCSPIGKSLNINYHDSVIVSFVDEDGRRRRSLDLSVPPPPGDGNDVNESIIIYAPTNEGTNDPSCNPLLSYRLGKKLGLPMPLPLHKKGAQDLSTLPSQFLTRTIPHNLRYPTGGIFGQNIVIVGFLPNEFDVSIFIYNKPTGKWSRLNIFCSHDYGLHRFWGGFVWSSHHKVILLGNYVTSRTTSSMRYFLSMITVSLPVMNILTSLELAGGHLPCTKPGHHHHREGFTSENSEATSHAGASLNAAECQESETLTSCEEISLLSPLDLSEEDDAPMPSRKFLTISGYSAVSARSEGRKTHTKATFSEYVHYAAPKVKFTNVRSVFPPAAITLGRNAFDRYGDMISDFELILSNGDRIPVCMVILMERWGKYFVDLLSRAYVKAIDQFERDQIQSFSFQTLRLSKSSDVSEDFIGSRGSISDSSRDDSSAERVKEKFHLQMKVAVNGNNSLQKDAPQFRLPFQDKSPLTESLRDNASVDPHNSSPERRSSVGLNISGLLILYLHLRHIPAQLPLPTEPIPDVPASPSSYRSSSRNNSLDPLSPRASLMHTLSVLRNIPKLPKGSPFTSPRGSLSMHGEQTTRHKQWFKSRDDNKDTNQNTGIITPPSRKSSDSGISSLVMPPLPRLASGDLDKRSETPKLGSHSRDDLYGHSGDEQKQGKPLLDFDTVDPTSFKLEPSLIPRKLYIPFGTTSIKAFAEFFYTGQVGNKWTLRPCALDCMLMARYFKVPLLYDLICEVLFGIIGRKEALVIKEGHKYKKKFMALFSKIETPLSLNFKFPLDEFEGFLDTIDDGFLDLALLRKLSNVHKLLHSSVASKRNSPSIGRSFDGSMSSPEKRTSRDGLHSPRSPPDVNSANLSSDNTSEDASEDEPAVALHYLDPEERNAIFGQRSKSIFDRSALDSARRTQSFEADLEELKDSKEKALTCTLESLVSPDAPEPSNYVIDLIYETASMCTDVKLMLRAMNARQMGLALSQTKRDYEIFLDAMNVSRNDEDSFQTSTNPVNVASNATSKATTGLMPAGLAQLDKNLKPPQRTAMSPAKKSPLLKTGSSGFLLTISPTTLNIAKEETWPLGTPSLSSIKSRSAQDSNALTNEKPLSMMRLKSEYKMSGGANAARGEPVRRTHTERHLNSVDPMTKEAGSSDELDDDDLQLIQTTNSRSSRSRLFGRLRGFTSKEAPDLKRSQSSASVFSIPSSKSTGTTKRGFLGLRKKS